MCGLKPDKPDVEIIDPKPQFADEQLALATRIADQTRRRRLAAFRETMNTGSQGLLGKATTTRTIATRGVA